jgi:hypothetical protein
VGEHRGRKDVQGEEALSSRSYTERELRLALEWAALRYPGYRTINRYRIATPPPFVPPGFTGDQAVALFRPTNFMADLVIVVGETTIVVEAKTDNESQAIGQLQFYVWLMEKYATLQDVPTSDVRPVLLYAREYPDLVAFAKKIGIDVELYSPDWIQPFLKSGYTGA